MKINRNKRKPDQQADAQQKQSTNQVDFFGFYRQNERKMGFKNSTTRADNTQNLNFKKKFRGEISGAPRLEPTVAHTWIHPCLISHSYLYQLLWILSFPRSVCIDIDIVPSRSWIWFIELIIKHGSWDNITNNHSTKPWWRLDHLSVCYRFVSLDLSLFYKIAHTNE